MSLISTWVFNNNMTQVFLTCLKLKLILNSLFKKSYNNYLFISWILQKSTTLSQKILINDTPMP